MKRVCLALWHLVAPGGAGIARRLVLGFALLLVIMTGVVGVTAWQAIRMERQLDAVVNQQVPRMIKVQSLARLVTELDIAARDAIIAADETASDAAVARIEAGRAKVGQQIEELQQSLRVVGPRGAQAATEIGDHSSGILIALVKFSRAVKSHNMDAARTVLASAIQPRTAALGVAVDNAQALQMALLEEAREASGRASRIALVEIAGALAVAIALAALLAWRISRGVVRPVNDAVLLAERISSGDLRATLQVTRGDELGRLQQALATMQGRLSGLVGDIRDVADQMAQASDEVASGSNDLSRRTESTASTLQAAASSMAQLTQQVRRTADSAQDANTLATNTTSVALRGGEVVSQVVTNMTDIAAASRRIADITTVIDGISFQTNILALNAAVEAARAGEHGRGFAVVAAEVRTLAQRAATASREIKTLIASSVEKVDSGCRLVQTAGGTMKDIVAGAQQVTGIVAGISAASHAQSGDLGHINDTVIHLDEMTQQNSALVEQSSAAAQNVLEQSRRLQAMVYAFKTDDRTTA